MTSAMSKKRLGLALVLISGVVFGTMPYLVTSCYEQGANAVLMLLARFVSLAIVVLPWALKGGGLLRAFRGNWKTLLRLSVAEGLTPLLLYTAYSHMATGLATTAHFLYPMVVALWCVLGYREKLSRGKLLCLILCIAGVALTVDLQGGRISLLGISLSLLSSVTYAAYIVWMGKSEMHQINPFQIAFFVGVGCGLLALVYGAVAGDLAAAANVTPRGWLSMAAAGAAIAVGGSLLAIFGIRYTDAQTAAIASTLEPLTSIVIGVAFLGETLGLAAAIGCGLILLAAVLLPTLGAREE